MLGCVIPGRLKGLSLDCADFLGNWEIQRDYYYDVGGESEVWDCRVLTPLSLDQGLYPP